MRQVWCMGCREACWLIGWQTKGVSLVYKPSGCRQSVSGWFQVLRCFTKWDNLTTWSGSNTFVLAFYGQWWLQLHVLLVHQSDQAEDLGNSCHEFQFQQMVSGVPHGNWVNAPLIREFKLICMGGYNLWDVEWSLAFEGEFPSQIS